jgi:hypothetical protein
MTKRMVRLTLAGLLVFVAATLPYGATAKAAPQHEPEVSLAFLECTENEYRHKRHMISDGCVWRLQTFLNEMKWMRDAANKNNDNWPTLEIDAIYGPETKKAVKAYQQATRSDGVPGNAGAVDGIVGHRTWATIQTDCVNRWGHDHDFHSQACFAR